MWRGSRGVWHGRAMRFLPLALLLLTTPLLAAENAGLKTRHVLFITTDGLRWQDLFRGAEEQLMNKANGGVPSEAALREQFWAETPEARRARLMPFVWSEIAQHGQLFGNRDAGSEGGVTNGKNFSYPGYSEFLTGHADDRIKSNKPVPNPNVNVLEWLLGRPGFEGKVAVINAWQAMPAILNRDRSKLPMWTPGVKDARDLDFPRKAEIEALAADIIQPWPDEHFDAFVFAAAKSYLAAAQPRVLYVNFGETDEWAHGQRYDRYLASARNVDRWVRELWETAQSIPAMRGTTTLIFTTDHGRGAGPQSWTSHGESIPESGEMWFAVLGPDTPPLGERKNAAPFKQAQTAATLARFLGEDYRAAVPEAAEPLAEVYPK
jgi:arylsulfatase A-like enzyme